MFKIALRNVFRNRRRTLLSLLLIALGTAVLFIVRGYIERTYAELENYSVDQYGHLQIADKSFWQHSSEGYEYLISKDKLARITEILNAEKEVESFTTQLSFSGLIGTERKSAVFSAIGLEPGSQFAGFSEYITVGSDLQEGDKGKALIGEELAQNLGVKIGDYVTVMGTTVDGAYNAGNLQIVGLLDIGQAEANARLGEVPLFFAQKMLNTEGIEKVIVKLARSGAIDKVLERLQKEFTAQGLNLEAKTWEELATYYRQVRAWMNVVFSFMTVAIFTLVFFSILEVMTMSFFERLREIGTIRAIGTKRHEVLRMFLEEGLLIGLIGGALGLALGWGLGWLINAAEIMYNPPGWSVKVPIEVQLGLSNGAIPFLAAVFSTLVSTFYPAYRASRVEIVEALRYV